MKKFVEDTKETKKLADEIRKLGIPYVSNEPGPVYWANFRVRVMESIAGAASKKPASLPARIRDFITGHVLETSISAATLAVLVTVAVLINPFGGGQQPPPMASVTPHPVSTQQATQVQLRQVTEPAKAQSNSSPGSAAVLQHSHPAAKKNVAERKDDLASLDENENESLSGIKAMGATDADNSVSLDELSEQQLKGLLKDMEGAE